MNNNKIKIDEATTCQVCSSGFKDPRILPCGKSACHKCIQKLIQSKTGSNFDCPLCGKKHRVPKDESFPSNKIAMKPTIKDEEKANGQNLINSVNDVQEHCIELRNKVHLERDVLIEHAHQCSDSLIAEIDKYENECVKSIKKQIKVKGDKLGLNEKKLEFIKKTDKHDKYLLGSLSFKYSGLKPQNLKKVDNSDEIFQSVKSDLNLLRTSSGVNVAFYIDKSAKLQIVKFSDSGKIIQRMVNPFLADVELDELKVVACGEKYVVHVDFSDLCSELSVIGHKLRFYNSIDCITVVLDKNFAYCCHMGNDSNHSFVYLAANDSCILYTNFMCKFFYMDSELEDIDYKPIEINEKFRHDTCSIKMNNEHIFFLFKREKLDIFDIKTGRLVKSIKVDAHEIKLLSDKLIVLLNSCSLKAYLYAQSSDFAKLEETDLSASLERNCLMSADNSNTILFYVAELDSFYYEEGEEQVVIKSITLD